MVPQWLVSGRRSCVPNAADIEGMHRLGGSSYCAVWKYWFGYLLRPQAGHHRVDTRDLQHFAILFGGSQRCNARAVLCAICLVDVHLRVSQSHRLVIIEPDSHSINQYHQLGVGDRHSDA